MSHVTRDFILSAAKRVETREALTPLCDFNLRLKIRETRPDGASNHISRREPTLIR